MTAYEKMLDVQGKKIMNIKTKDTLAWVSVLGLYLFGLLNLYSATILTKEGDKALVSGGGILLIALAVALTVMGVTSYDNKFPLRRKSKCTK
jgi:hypothetical protein